MNIFSKKNQKNISGENSESQNKNVAFSKNISSNGFKDAFLWLLKPLRPEERILVMLWIAGMIIIAVTGTGLPNLTVIFKSYLKFFMLNLLYLATATRVMFYLDETWRPKSIYGQRIKFWIWGTEGTFSKIWIDKLFNKNVSKKEENGVLKTDLTFLRGFLFFNANIAIYTNIKTRIPFFKPIDTGDVFFEKLDNLIFGRSLISKIETWVSSNSDVNHFLQKVYMHDYIWFIALLAIFYFRRDVFSLRWSFASISITYLAGILITAMYPSAGPCFIHVDRFAWLQDSTIGHAQKGLSDYFWFSKMMMAKHGELISRPFVGIAAFPSLHVAHMALVMWIALKKIPLLGIWMIWVTFTTFIATIGFGWHYAMDGIGGIIIAIIISESLYRFLNYKFKSRART